MKCNFFIKNTVPAFTLVELLVVLGLFSSIATLSLGALFNAQVINAKLQETQSILDNINLSAITVTRDIRFGSDFYCATSLPTNIPTIRKNCEFGVNGATSGNVLIFRPADATDDRDRIAYYLKNGILFKDEYPFGLTPTKLQMTSNDVVIKSLIFYVEGAQTSDGVSDFGGASDLKQPLITLLLSGETKPTKASVAPVPFDLQTVISTRDLDNK